MLSYLRNIDNVYLVVLSGNLLALTAGTKYAWSSPVLTKLSSNVTDNPLGVPLSKNEQSWIASLAGLGSIFGVIPFIFLPNLIGRKPTLLLISIPYMISYGLSAVATRTYMLYIAKILIGIPSAACCTVLPMYVAEISEKHNRGSMLVSFTIFAHFGGVICYFTGPVLSMFWFNALLLLFPTIFFISFSLIAPESPYFYVMKKDYSRAIQSIETLRCNNSIKNTQLELENIKKEIEKVEETNFWVTLTKIYAMKGCLIAIVLNVFTTLSGISVFTSYSQQIFLEAGYNMTDSEKSSMIVGSVSFLASLYCPFIIDKKGRRFVLIVSISGIIISELTFGSFYYMKELNYSIISEEWTPLVCLVVYMLFFNFGLGPLSHTLTSEILPANIKFFVSILGGIFGGLCSTILLKYYYFLNDYLNHYGTVWVFAGFSMFLLIFVLLFLPETKGKSLSQILNELGR